MTSVQAPVWILEVEPVMGVIGDKVLADGELADGEPVDDAVTLDEAFEPPPTKLPDAVQSTSPTPMLSQF